MLPFRQDDDFTLRNALFGTTKLSKNADKDEYKYSESWRGLDNHWTVSLCNGSGFGKNVISFRTDLSSSEHVYKRKNDILILGKGPADGLDDTKLFAEKQYSINFTEHNKKILHCNEADSYIFVNGVEIYKIEAKEKRN